MSEPTPLTPPRETHCLDPVQPHMRAAFYATRPTRWTRFLRVFILWQLWRFVAINVRMMWIIAAGHSKH